jgi:hypothetical protein
MEGGLGQGNPAAAGGTQADRIESEWLAEKRSA